MQIGGIQRFSSIDFPGHLAAVVFTIGCNFRCPFCHNLELVTGEANTVSEKSVLEFLSTRTRQLEGVVISGGEPTLQQDLSDFVGKIRSFGFHVKLDTNGTHPDVLKYLMLRQMLDFVAMDIKHIWSRYAYAVGLQSMVIEKIQQSAALIMASDIDYEFRTTVIKDFHDPQDIITISKQIRGAKRYVVQKFIPDKTLHTAFRQKLTFERSDFQKISAEIKKNVQQFEMRL
ncbi:MAG: anaerobic ribonucleoside-triphosphate reductase activating protein [Puniceicoccales bacterium]|jgi:pyruvate formate lyase activating enzyme|nr:anaerobic ribonucleoside-triphosphate reductase activating protein [Puniceicoccales bacterium]